MSEDTRHVIVEDETLAAGFTQIPNLVLRRPDLSPGAKLTYMVLLSYAWQSDSCYPGQDRLAGDMGVSERSVITYLKQLSESGLVTIRRRGLGMTNVYVLHRLRAGGEKSAPQEVQDPAPLEVQPLQLTNTQGKKTQRENLEDSNGTRNVDKYNETRDVIGSYVTDFALEMNDQAPITSSITRAQNLYRSSGRTLEQFAEAMYQARQITKERSASIKGSAQSMRGKPKMQYFFAVLEDVLQ